MAHTLLYTKINVTFI